MLSAWKDIRNIGAEFHFTSHWLVINHQLQHGKDSPTWRLHPFIVIPPALWLKLVIRRSSSSMNNI
eukprot:scaffold619168_cov17-Prasinocladus_malaysianus.AAC.1